MRTLLLAWLALMAASGCSSLPGPPDYSTPEKTLISFHDAFKHEVVAREYECLSQAFKENRGNLNLAGYHEFRRNLKDEYPIVFLLLSLNDIEDNIVEVRYRGDEADVDVSFAGNAFTITMIRETIVRFEFDKGRVKEDRIFQPLPSLLTLENAWLGVMLPMDERILDYVGKKIQYLRKILVEKRWKFLDFSIEDEKITGST
jgi:hypothetical protein